MQLGHKKSVLLIGLGRMGTAASSGLLRSGAWRVIGFDTELAARERARQLGVDVREGIVGADVAVLAVKPKDVSSAASLVRESSADFSVLVSFAAGIPLSKLRELLPAVEVVRAMPNLPAAVGEAMTVFCAAGVSDRARELTQELVASFGRAIEVEEGLLDAATALSGSGPAYVFYFLEALIESASELGFDPEVSRLLALQTLIGSASLVAERGADPAQLRSEVTSPAGTTEAAIRVLEQSGFKGLLAQAVKAARRRAEELSGS